MNKTNNFFRFELYRIDIFGKKSLITTNGSVAGITNALNKMQLLTPVELIDLFVNRSIESGVCRIRLGTDEYELKFSSLDK